MASIFGRWFGYGLGSSVGRALFGEDPATRSEQRAPVSPARTEAEFRADEKRFAEDEKRLDAESETAKK